MDELFSCRNCVENCGQTLNIGRSIGFCLRHGAIVKDPISTTCKYLHRKDLPWFVVDEARSEHAAEFSGFTGMAGLYSHEPIKHMYYSERYVWENKSFDSLTNALARYHFAQKKWIFIESLTGGIDGRRAVAQASLTRRYMSVCETWKSSFRLTLDVVQQLPQAPAFLAIDINESGGGEEQAFWDVIFSRITLVQEYGWHAGLEKLQWLTDSLKELQTFQWSSVQPELEKIVPIILEAMFRHAQDNDGYFDHAALPEDRAPEGLISDVE